MGGGMIAMGGEVGLDSDKRVDGRDLTKDWQNDKAARGLTYAFVKNEDELEEIDTETTDSILG